VAPFTIAAVIESILPDAPRGLGGGLFEARQAGVDALYRRVGPVGVDFDDEFELVIRHRDESLALSQMCE
jgi:hypothetical protein